MCCLGMVRSTGLIFCFTVVSGYLNPNRIWCGGYYADVNFIFTSTQMVERIFGTVQMRIWVYHLKLFYYTFQIGCKVELTLKMVERNRSNNKNKIFFGKWSFFQCCLKPFSLWGHHLLVCAWKNDVFSLNYMRAGIFNTINNQYLCVGRLRRVIH